MSIKIVQYKPEDRVTWDKFVDDSKNGTFLFNRGYMDYHSDRFQDFSLMFFDDNKLVGLLPANIKDAVIYSHGGLTYGGVLSGSNMKAVLMLQIFDSLKAFLKDAGVSKVVYKAIPRIFHSLPSDEDLYALFRHNAVLVKRELSSAIELSKKEPFNAGRRQRIRKAKDSGLQITEGQDFEIFFQMVAEVLKTKHGINPTHAASEMKLLAERFPENIKFYIATKDDTMLAGSIVYETKTSAHVQYMSANSGGRKISALDFLLDYLINEMYVHKSYMSFGISTEQAGLYLNEGLANQKEELGGKAIVHDTYEFSV